MTKPKGTKKAADRSSGNSPPKGRIAPTRARAWQPTRHDPTLGRYFQDLAEYEVLTSEQEVEEAKRLADLEIERWRILLGEPLLAADVLDAVGELLDEEERDEELDKQCARVARMARARVKSKKAANPTRTYTKAVDELAARLHEVDLKRDLVAAAHGTIKRSAARSGGADDARRLKKLARSCEQIAARVQAAKHAFIRANLRLVVAIARRYDRGQMPLIDLIQEGNLGLIKAVERFDYRRGFRFSTYASWWIRHAIGRALADKGQAVRVPVHALDAQQRVNRATEQIGLRTGRTATDEEIIKETGIDKRRLARVRKHQVNPVTSLDREISGSDNRRYVDLLADESMPTPFDNTLLGEWTDDMEDVLDVLTDMERSIIRWRFGLDSEGEEMTLKEIGDHYNLSRERIRQLQEQALRKIRRRLSLDAA